MEFDSGSPPLRPLSAAAIEKVSDKVTPAISDEMFRRDYFLSHANLNRCSPVLSGSIGSHLISSEKDFE